MKRRAFIKNLGIVTAGVPAAPVLGEPLTTFTSGASGDYMPTPDDSVATLSGDIELRLLREGIGKIFDEEYGHYNLDEIFDGGSNH